MGLIKTCNVNSITHQLITLFVFCFHMPFSPVTSDRSTDGPPTSTCKCITLDHSSGSLETIPCRRLLSLLIYSASQAYTGIFMHPNYKKF